MPINKEIPPVIATYRILAPLGEGGMGVVYKAEQTTLKRIVALKIICPEVGQEKTFAERLMREANLAASIDHPNVVTIYDAGDFNGLFYMAMRYVAGGDVWSMLSKDGRLAEELALRIAVDCAKGLQAIHKVGLVHRDIKPANIFLEEDGTARIGDLGLARTAKIEQDFQRFTKTGLAMGTVGYMSPEQVKGLPDIDIRSDIYSLGMTLFHFLTGRLAFEATSPLETVAKILYEAVPNPRTINGRISSDTAAVILKAVERDRDKRYSSPAEFLEDLQAVVAKRPPIHAGVSDEEKQFAEARAQRRRAAAKKICTMCLRSVEEEDLKVFNGQRLCEECHEALQRKTAKREEAAATAPSPPQTVTPIPPPAPAGASVGTMVYRGRVVNADGTEAPIESPVAKLASRTGALFSSLVARAKAAAAARAEPANLPPGTRMYRGRIIEETPLPATSSVSLPPTVEPPPPPPPETDVLPIADPAPEAASAMPLTPTVAALPPIPPPPEVIPEIIDIPVVPAQTLTPLPSPAPQVTDATVQTATQPTAVFYRGRVVTASGLDETPVENKKGTGLRLREMLGRALGGGPQDTNLMALTGTLKDHGIAQILQVINLLAKSGELYIQGRRARGMIAFDKGRVLYAISGNDTGENAVYVMARENEGSFRFKGLDAAPTYIPNIAISTMQLILECCKLQDDAAIAK